MVQGMRKSLNIPDMEPDEWEMANEDKQCDQHFQELMDTCKIPPDLQDHLIHEGFTDSGIFAFAFSKPEKFEDYLVNFVAKNLWMTLGFTLQRHHLLGFFFIEPHRK